MASLDHDRSETTRNPLDVVEQLVAAKAWAYDRAGDDEIAVQVDGRWCAYRLWFAWEVEFDAMLFSCAFDMKLPETQRLLVHSLLALINERMWVGHFDIGAEDGAPTFRHGVLLSGGAAVSLEQVEDLVDIAISECERFYPAFQYVIWGGKKPGEALQMAVLDPVGEA